MKIKSEDFRAKEGDKVNLKKWPARVKPAYRSKHNYENSWPNRSRNSATCS